MNQTTADTSGTQAVIDVAVRSAEPAKLEIGHVYAFHTSSGVEQVDLTGDQYRINPSRKTGNTSVSDAASFAAYWAKHSDQDSEVYADAGRFSVTAVLDAHTAAGARRGQHRLHLALQRTPAWKAWEAFDGRLLKQVEFADHLEARLPDLLDPDAATMLEIAQSLQATTKVDFQSGVRLQSGERQFKYVETTTATAGTRADLTIPEVFIVGLHPFEGGRGYQLKARLRYRIEGSALTIGYRFEQPEVALREAFDDVVTDIAGQIETTVMNGTPA